MVDLAQTLAGAGAGAFPAILLYPLDFVKVRLEASQHKLTLLDCISCIIREEGCCAFYHGLMPSLVGASISWAVYFTLYANAKVRYLSLHVGGQGSLPWVCNMMSSCEAGVLTTLLTNPIWLIKTRMQLHSSATKHAHCEVVCDQAHSHVGPLDCLVRVIREEGMFALWKGIVPALWLVSHGMVQMMLYEKLKQSFEGNQGGSVHKSGEQDNNVHKIGSLGFLVMGSLSKAGASLATFPLEVIKTRLQAPRHTACQYNGFIDCATKILQDEGICSFYKGFFPNIVRVMPASALTFCAYENILIMAQHHVGINQEHQFRLFVPMILVCVILFVGFCQYCLRDQRSAKSVTSTGNYKV